MRQAVTPPNGARRHVIVVALPLVTFVECYDLREVKKASKSASCWAVMSYHINSGINDFC
jgi:hypothetical protein